MSLLFYMHILFTCTYLCTLVVSHNNNFNLRLFRYTTESHFVNNNNTTVFRSSSPKETSMLETPCKWKVCKNRDKKYELLNLLWKKTKILEDATDEIKGTTDERIRKPQTQILDENPRQEVILTPKPLKIPLPHRESDIEFYYFNDIDLNKDIALTSKLTKSNSNVKHSKSIRSHLPLDKNALIFLYPNQNMSTNKNDSNRVENTESVSTISTPSTISNIFSTPSTISNISSETTANKKEVFPVIGIYGDVFNDQSIPVMNISTKKNEININKTRDDRVKFFDIYDSETYSPLVLTATTERNDSNKSREPKSTSTTTTTTNLVNQDNLNNLNNLNETVSNLKNVKKHFINVQKTKDDDIEMQTTAPDTMRIQNHTETAAWSEYSYIAAYVYEPLNVRCDAAAISPHWLISSAACLYRHHKNPKSEHRSAYVIYCTDNWRFPMRISYVRRSILHPQFHPIRTSRSHTYNIGVIQVVNSMADTCTGWKSVTLLSHQLTDEYNGSTVTALGWGLNRYSTYMRYSYQYDEGNLMSYKNSITIKSCPGVMSYNQLTQKKSEATNNVCCFSLSIPSIASESLHGGLLLLERKLVGLYLSEDRKFFSSKQSATYTGVWKHIPWIFDVSREPENSEFLLDV